MSGLILGKNGQLASHLRQLLPDATCWGRQEHDLSRPAATEQAIIELSPAYIICAAAYTAVDKAEEEPDAAWRLNATGVANAACAARILDIPLLHISTDYVFDGSSAQPYSVDSPVRPINTYGITKLAGELAVRTMCTKYWILRTSWVFSEYGNNFVKTIINIARERDELNIVNDQHGIPTYAGQLAETIAALVASSNQPKPAHGTYHAVGGPIVSWYQFARQFLAMAAAAGLIDKLPQLNPIPSLHYPTPAKRPSNSALQASPEIEACLGRQLDWRRGLEATIAGLGNATAAVA